jgi:hypothetical protein
VGLRRRSRGPPRRVVTGAVPFSPSNNYANPANPFEGTLGGKDVPGTSALNGPAFSPSSRCSSIDRHVSRGRRNDVCFRRLFARLRPHPTPDTIDVTVASGNDAGTRARRPVNGCPRPDSRDRQPRHHRLFRAPIRPPRRHGSRAKSRPSAPSGLAARSTSPARPGRCPRWWRERSPLPKPSPSCA